MQRIVLTTDLSEEARRPFLPVAALANELGAELVLLHVIQTLTGATQGGRLDTPPDGSVAKTDAQRSLDALASEFPAGTKVSTRVVTAKNVAEGILSGALDCDADLVALSTHGRTGLRRLVLGSVTEDVLRHAHLPVLCFPPGTGPAVAPLRLSHVLLTTDGSDEALRPFEAVFELASTLGFQVTVLHVAEEESPVTHGAPPLAPAVSAPVDPPSLERQMAAARRVIEVQCGPRTHGVQPKVEVLEHRPAAESIVRFAQENDVDLIALSTHGRTGFRRLVFGSVAEEVLHQSPVPVLGFPRRDG